MLKKLANGIWESFTNQEHIRNRHTAKELQFKIKAIATCQNECKRIKIDTSRIWGITKSRKGFGAAIRKIPLIGQIATFFRVGYHDTMDYEKLLEKLNLLYTKIEVRIRKFKNLTNQLKLNLSVSDTQDLQAITTLAISIRNWLEKMTAYQGEGRDENGEIAVGSLIDKSQDELKLLYTELAKDSDEVRLYTGRSFKAKIGLASEDNLKRQKARKILRIGTEEKMTKKQVGERRPRPNAFQHTTMMGGGHNLITSRPGQLGGKIKAGHLSGTLGTRGGIKRALTGTSIQKKEIMSDMSTIQGHINEEGGEVLGNMIELRQVLENIESLPMFRFHPLFSLIPKKLNDINVILDAIPSQAKKFVKKNGRVLKAIDKYKAQLGQLTAAIATKENEMKRVFLEQREEIIPFAARKSNDEQLFEKVKELAKKEEIKPVEINELFEAENNATLRAIDGKLLTKKAEGSPAQVQGGGADVAEKEEVIRVEQLDSLTCIGCTEYNITNDTYKSTFRDVILTPNDVSNLFTEEMESEARKEKLLNLEGDNFTHLGRIAYIYESLANLASNKSNEYLQNLSNPNRNKQKFAQKNTVACLLIRQNCIEKAYLFLKEYIMKNHPDKVHHINFRRVADPTEDFEGKIQNLHQEATREAEQKTKIKEGNELKEKISKRVNENKQATINNHAALQNKVLQDAKAVSDAKAALAANTLAPHGSYFKNKNRTAAEKNLAEAIRNAAASAAYVHNNAHLYDSHKSYTDAMNSLGYEPSKNEAQWNREQQELRKEAQEQVKAGPRETEKQEALQAAKAKQDKELDASKIRQAEGLVET